MERDLQDIKEEVKARTDIVELIGGYTRLKRSGKNWTGLCPFHADKRPSFSVSPLGFYKCFSCGESGDLFTFVQKKEGLDFVESLEWLCRRAGINFTRSAANPEKASEREEALELNRIAVAFYQDSLARSSDARNILAERAILKPTQEQWEIGYAPPDWDALVRQLERLKANLPLAVKIDLIKERKTEGTGYYDTFRNRLIFPIHDIGGRVIAFGGRAISKDEQAKYLNTGQTPLFDKSKTLYGLHFARRKLSGDTPAVFVEGYVDVIATHQAGFAQCVATLGTSMTEEHAKMLVRYNSKVIICYDADAAGIRATLRGTSVWDNLGVEGAEVKVARLPAGEDPDSLLRHGETSVFQAALDNAIPRVEFEIDLIRSEHDLKTDVGRATAYSEVLAVLATLSSLAERSRYINRYFYLHPLNDKYEPRRVVDQFLADVENYLQHNKKGLSPRDKGYPLTQDQNQQPLGENPPPPSYQPPNRQQWGRAEWPHTRNIVRKGEGGGYDDRNRRFDKRRDPNRPAFSDPTPPELTAPALTGAEKAERQLLLALFTADWRTYILARLPSDCFATESGKRLFACVARTPATEDGSIDALTLLRQIEREEEDPTFQPAAALSHASAPVSEAFEEDPFAGDTFPDEEADPFANEAIPLEEAAAFSANGSSSHSLDTEASPSDPPFPVSRANEVGTGDGEVGQREENFTGWEGISEGSVETANIRISRQVAKLSAFLREVLEDSPFIVSKEHLSEAVVNDCIRRLQKHRDEQVRRELEEVLRQADPMPLDQRRAFIEQYHQKMRETRGSPPNAKEDDTE